MHLFNGVQTHYMYLNGHTTHMRPVALILETEPTLEMRSLIKEMVEQHPEVKKHTLLELNAYCMLPQFVFPRTMCVFFADHVCRALAVKC